MLPLAQEPHPSRHPHQQVTELSSTYPAAWAPSQPCQVSLCRFQLVAGDIAVAEVAASAADIGPGGDTAAAFEAGLALTAEEAIAVGNCYSPS